MPRLKLCEYALDAEEVFSRECHLYAAIRAWIQSGLDSFRVRITPPAQLLFFQTGCLLRKEQNIKVENKKLAIVVFSGRGSNHGFRKKGWR